MQREVGQPGNFEANNPNHTAFLLAVFDRLNELYSQVNAPACGGMWQPFLDPRDSRIRFQLEGIYYHKDDIGYINNGSYNDSYCLDHYGSVCGDATFPVFFCQYSSTNSGYGPQTHIMMNNVYSYYTGTGAPGYWGVGNVLGHEFGHVFSLYHSWLQSERNRFPDICQLATSDQFCEPVGDPLCSNNVMGRARIKDHFSPLQMAAMHQHILTNGFTKFLVHTYDQSQSVLVKAPGQTWEVNRLINGDIIVGAGATLTIRSRIIMPPNGRIIVGRGARLNIEGGYITTKGPHKVVCNGQEIREEAMWWGIEVWGNSSVVPTPAMLNDNYALGPNDPGVVILRQYGDCRPRIENAKRGIMTFPNYGPWAERQHQFGGLILAEDADFVNCRKGAEIVSVYTAATVSQFRRCHFYQNYLLNPDGSPAQTYEGVTIWNTEGALDASQQIVGLVFEDDCVFENLERGIGSGNATKRVSNCTFTNCKYATELGQTAPMLGKSSIFNNNQYTRVNRGVYGHSYRQAFVRFNHFDNSSNGVTLFGAGRFTVNENEFRYNLNAAGPNFLDAIGMYQTGSTPNDIFCNQYFSPNSNENHIFEGIYFEGDNSGSTFRRESFDCWVDVRLVKSVDASTGQVTAGKLAGQIGATAPRNIFSPLYGHSVDIFTASSNPVDPDGGSTLIFNYNILQGLAANSREIPRCPAGGVGFNPGCPYQYNFYNQVATLEAEPCGMPRPRNCRETACLEALQQTLRTRRAQLARGNSASLLLQVQTMPSAPLTQSNLQAATPYLSDDILLAILASNAWSAQGKYNWLAANAPVSATVLNAAAGVLPAMLYNQLAGLSPVGSRTPRQVLQGQIDALEYQKNDALELVTDSLFRAGNYAGVDALLIADSTQASRQLRIGLKFQINDLNGAYSLLNTYPVNDAEDLFFRQIERTYWRLLSQPENFTLTPNEHDSLWIAAERHYRVSGYAQTLLIYLEGASFDPVKAPYGLQGEARVEDRDFATMPLAAPTPSRLLLSPNPVSDVLLVNWSDEQNATMPAARLGIYDLSGTERLGADVIRGENTITVSRLPAGLYFVRLYGNNGQPRGSARFVKL